MIYVTLDNKESMDQITLSTYDTKVTADGKDYFAKDAPVHKMDQNLFNGVSKGNVLNGYIVIPTIPEETKNMSIYLKMYKNGIVKENYDVYFNVKR